MKIKKISHLLLFVVIILPFLTLETDNTWAAEPAGRITNVPPEIRFLAAGIGHARSKLSSATAILTFSRSAVDPPLPEDLLRQLKEQKMSIALPPQGQKHERKINSDWSLHDSKLSVWLEAYDNAIPNYLQRLRFLFDEKQVMLLLGRDRIGISQEWTDIVQKSKFDSSREGIIAPEEDFMEEGFWKFGRDADLRTYTYDGPVKLDSVLLDPQYRAASKGQETIYGDPCEKIEISNANGHAFYWIDTKHGYLTRKVENYALIKGTPVLVAAREVPSVLESNGIYCPGVYQQRKKNFSKDEVDKEWSSVFNVTVSNFRANTDDIESGFEMNWAPEAIVRDRLSGKTYQVDKNRELKEIRVEDGKIVPVQ